MSEVYATAIARRFREELIRCGIRSEKEAAEKLGKPQQWLDARQRTETAWGAAELHWACGRLSLNFMYVVTGQRKSDIAAELLAGIAAIIGEQRRVIDAPGQGSLSQIFEHYFGEGQR
jgi:hypothetical protein